MEGKRTFSTSYLLVNPTLTRKRVAYFEGLLCTDSKSLVTLARATYRLQEIIDSFSTTQPRPPTRHRERYHETDQGNVFELFFSQI